MTNDEKQADKIFRARYGANVNIVTPNLVERGMAHGLAYEISEGRSMSDRTIYGVTVLNPDGTDAMRDDAKLSRMTGYSLQGARAYVEEGFYL